MLTKSDLSQITKIVEPIKDEILEMRKEHKGYRDEVLSKMDGVMGELQAMREENTVGTYQTSQLREEVDNHEKRIKHLEKIQPAI